MIRYAIQKVTTMKGCLWKLTTGLITLRQFLNKCQQCSNETSHKVETRSHLDKGNPRWKAIIWHWKLWFCVYKVHSYVLNRRFVHSLYYTHWFDYFQYYPKRPSNCTTTYNSSLIFIFIFPNVLKSCYRVTDFLLLPKLVIGQSHQN